MWPKFPTRATLICLFPDDVGLPSAYFAFNSRVLFAAQTITGKDLILIKLNTASGKLTVSSDKMMLASSLLKPIKAALAQ